MAYNIDTDRLIDVVEKELLHQILKYKCSEAFQAGRSKGLIEGHKKGVEDGWSKKRKVYESEIERLKFLLNYRHEGIWIPVDVRLPEESETVLACGSHGGIYPARIKQGVWYRPGVKHHYCNPIYWMQMPKLPELPKEVRE